MEPRLYSRLLLRLLALPIAALTVLALILGYGLQRIQESASTVDRADVVILHGALQRALAGALADAVRACGAHAIWRLMTLNDALPDAWSFADPPRPGFDAYVLAWQSAGLAAFMPAPDLVSAKAGGATRSPSPAAS